MIDPYRQAVKTTFIDGLRSVLLVDDAFPTLADMILARASDDGRFREAPRAAKLYEGFKKRHLPCDVENTFAPDDIDMIERMRKCDLIVLDLHLDATDTNSDISLHLLSRLATSDDFNTVILYTKADDLMEVWLDVAANLRPDLSDPDAFLSGREKEEEAWSQITPDDLARPSGDALAGYLRNGLKGVGQESAALIRAVTVAGVKCKGGMLLEAFLRHHVKRRRSAFSKRSESDARSRTLRGRYDKSRPLWLQSGGCFVVIIGKAADNDVDEVEHIFAKLLDALVDWRPNFLQMLISEIQNRLEVEALATDVGTFSEPVLQTGLSHYLLETLREDPDDDAAVEATIDRVVETVRHKLSGNKPLREFARSVLVERRAALASSLTGEDAVAAAAALAHLETPPDSKKVLFFLNSFLSSENFNRSRITTGTVFRREERYWMVVSPACDMTGRRPKQAWTRDLHPVRAMIALRAEVTSTEAALREATLGRSAFLRIADADVALRLFPNSITPAPEIFFAEDAGQVVILADRAPTFRAAQVRRSPEGTPATAVIAGAVEYEVVGQLRANYASRMLQFTSGHLGRIGVDFFNSQDGEEDAAAL